MLRKVFYNSLALYNIRLIEGWSGAFGINDRAFTLANTIYMKRNDPAVRPDILVHECVHVWQYQNIGSRYTMDALGAQAIYGDAAYDWEAELAFELRGFLDRMAKAGNPGIVSFRLFDIAMGKPLRPTVRGWPFFLGGMGGTGIDHADLATQAIKSLRGRINLRRSRSF